MSELPLDISGCAVYLAEDCPREGCVVCLEALKVMSPDYDIFTPPRERVEALHYSLADAVRRNRLVLCAHHMANLRQTIADDASGTTRQSPSVRERASGNDLPARVGVVEEGEDQR